MEPGGSMPHSQGLSNNSYPEPKSYYDCQLKYHVFQWIVTTVMWTRIRIYHYS